MKTILRGLFLIAAIVSFTCGVALLVTPPHPDYKWVQFVYAPMLFGPAIVWLVACVRLGSTISEPTLRGAWLLGLVYLTFPLGLIPTFPMLPFAWLLTGVPLGQLFYRRRMRDVCAPRAVGTPKPNDPSR